MYYILIAPAGSGHHLFYNCSKIPYDYSNPMVGYILDNSQNCKVTPYSDDNYDTSYKIHDDFLFLHSFPYKFMGDVTRKPDLFLLEKFPKEKKMFFLWRDPLEIIHSTYRRFGWMPYADTYEKMAHILFNNLVFISAYIRINLKGKAKVFTYNQICDYPDRFTEETGIPLDKSKIVKSKQKIPDVYLFLKVWFDERKLYYKELLDNIVDLSIQ